VSERISVNTLLRDVDSGKLYRVLWLSHDSSTAYVFNITDMEMPITASCEELQTGTESGALVVEKTDPYVAAVFEDTLTGKEKEIRDKVWAFIGPIAEREPAIFIKKERGRILTEAVNKTGKKLFTFHRYLKIYWKYGKTKNAFIPKYENCGGPGKQRKAGEIKRGRPSKYGSTNINVDESTLAIFEKAIRKHYLNRKEHTLQYAYDMMIAEHYANYVVQPDGKNIEHWFVKAKARSWKIDISYDPRNMNAIYVRNSDGSVETCWLSNWQDKYVGKTLDEILFLHEAEKAVQHKNRPKEMASKADLSATINGVIAEAEEMARQTAVPKTKSERTKSIHDNRRNEKAANRQEEAFSIGTGRPETIESPKAQNGSEAIISPVLAMIKQQLEERLNDK